MSKPNLDKYLEMKIQSASPQELLLITHDEGVKAMRRASRQMSKGNQVQAQSELITALACVLELDNTLDVKAAPELGANLHNLYMYLVDRIGDAIANFNQEAIDEAIRVLSDLHQTWRMAFEQGGVRIPEPA